MVLKELSNEIARILQIIFQIAFTTGQVPDDWKEANVAPILKKISTSLVPIAPSH